MIPKECLLCPQIIRPNFIVCKEHMKEYKEYGQTQWFKELSRMQWKQSRINNMESYSFENYYVANREVRIKYKRIGKVQTIPHDKVLKLTHDGMKPKQIAEELQCSQVAIYSILRRKFKVPKT